MYIVFGKQHRNRKPFQILSLQKSINSNSFFLHDSSTKKKKNTFIYLKITFYSNNLFFKTNRFRFVANNLSLKSNYFRISAYRLIRRSTFTKVFCDFQYLLKLKIHFFSRIPQGTRIVVNHVYSSIRISWCSIWRFICIVIRFFWKVYLHDVKSRY